MNLKTYLHTLPSGGQAEFAKQICVTHTYLSQLSGLQDGRVPSPSLCLTIENASEGKVTRQEMRPLDFWKIWPDLSHLAPSPEAAQSPAQKA